MILTYKKININNKCIVINIYMNSFMTHYKMFFS